MIEFLYPTTVSVADSQVSPRNRSHCRPGTGAASEKCQPATGATVSIMNGVAHSCGAFSVERVRRVSNACPGSVSVADHEAENGL